MWLFALQDQTAAKFGAQEVDDRALTAAGSRRPQFEGTVETAVLEPEMREFAAARKAGDRIDLTMTRALAISIEDSR